MIGVFGGTFDPIHYGHLRSALEVKEIFHLEEIRLIVSAHPPHRGNPSTDPEKRLEMLMLAVQNQVGLIPDRREIDRVGYSYMVDTLKSIRHEMAESPLLLFIGTDAFSGLSSWYQWKSLFDIAHIVVITRPGYQYQPLSEFLANKLTDDKALLQNKKSGRLYFQSVTPIDISATQIRDKVEKGLNPRFLLPDCVIDYIKLKKLYLR